MAALKQVQDSQGRRRGAGPYIRDQMKFFVAKVDIKKVKRDAHGLVVLSPLRFSFDAAELRLPVRLGLLNAESKQDLIGLHPAPGQALRGRQLPQRLHPHQPRGRRLGPQELRRFYAELFDETLRRSNNKAVVTEYAWQTTGCDPCPTPPLDGQRPVHAGR